MLHCLHPFDEELSKTIQLSQNISTSYMGSIMIIFQFTKTADEAVNNSTETHVLPHTNVFSLHSGQARQVTLQMVSLEDVDLINRCTVLKLTGLPRAKLFYTKPPLTEPPSLLSCECPDAHSAFLLSHLAFTLNSLMGLFSSLFCC